MTGSQSQDRSGEEKSDTEQALKQPDSHISAPVNLANPEEVSNDLRKFLNNNPSDEDFQKFVNDSMRSAFFQKHRNNTNGNVFKGNIFHGIVTSSANWSREDINKALAWLFKKPESSTLNSGKLPSGAKYQYENLLEEDAGDGTPIFQALVSGGRRNLPFVEEILRLDPPPSNLGKIFYKPAKYYSWRYCLHAAIDAAYMQHDDFTHIHKIIRHTREHKSEQKRKEESPFAKAEGNSNNTPLHIAVAKAPIRLSSLNKSPTAATKDNIESSLSLIKALIEAYPKSLGLKNSVNGIKGKGRTPYQERIFRLRKGCNKWDGSNATTSGPPSQEDDSFRESVISDPIASYISYYTIVNYDRDKVMKYLYHSGQERAIEFDLLDFPRRAVTQDYLKSLETHVRFEKTLTYVALPRLMVEGSVASTRISPQSHAHEQLSPQSVTNSPSIKDFTPDVIALFSWLYKRHVRKIQRVTVIDNELPSHRDEEIINSLRNFDVEIWDWNKMDLSSEVICQSSKSVREIWLHSSGNLAVLNGWCAPEGFNNKEKFPELRDIYIHLHEGQEGGYILQERARDVSSKLERGASEALVTRAAQCSDATAYALQAIELIDDIMKQKTDQIDVENIQTRVKNLKDQVGNLSLPHTLGNRRLNVSFDIIPRGTQTRVGVSDVPNTGDNRRISSIRELTNYLRNNRQVDRRDGLRVDLPYRVKMDLPYRVKIAIIDDGLGSSPYIIDRKYSNIVAGQSFCTSSSGFMSVYYAPSGNHGTQVASLICQICPEVDLFVARLDEQYTRSGNRVIHPLSAEKAVKWATECGVDIICMSWTIEQSDGPTGLEGLEKAIKKAKENSIIMFCSASDQGGSSKIFCYPGAFDNNCIRIGSCSGSDVPSVGVNPHQIDFLMPGENIMVRNSDGTQESQSGSSFATAVAAGLGGLLLYCTVNLRMGKSPSQNGMESANTTDYTVGQNETGSDQSNSEEDVSENSDTATINDYRRSRARQPSRQKYRKRASMYKAGSGQNNSEEDVSENSDDSKIIRLDNRRKRAKQPSRQIQWNRASMYKAFTQLSVSQGKYSLVKPEERIIEKLKEQLGIKGKSLDRLEKDRKFDDALQRIFEGLMEQPKDAGYNSNYKP